LTGASARHAYVYEALRAGASGFVLKDDPPEQLLPAIRIVAGGDASSHPVGCQNSVRVGRNRRFTGVTRILAPHTIWRRCAEEITDEEIELEALAAIADTKPTLTAEIVSSFEEDTRRDSSAPVRERRQATGTPAAEWRATRPRLSRGRSQFQQKDDGL
jgi:hypothetical protein